LKQVERKILDYLHNEEPANWEDIPDSERESAEASAIKEAETEKEQ
jgi:hypothetical protein